MASGGKINAVGLVVGVTVEVGEVGETVVVEEGVKVGETVEVEVDVGEVVTVGTAEKSGH
jgi:hypothetical protein